MQWPYSKCPRNCPVGFLEQKGVGVPGVSNLIGQNPSPTSSAPPPSVVPSLCWIMPPTRHDDRVATKSIFDFKVKDATGGEVDLSTYRGEKKAFLVVNVASK